MRQIEKEMRYALRNGENFHSNNTTVTHDNGNSYVYLFGNLIYKVVNGKAYFSLAGWNTNTTRSRLNALGVNVSQKKGTPHYNGKPIHDLQGFFPVEH